MSALLTPFRKGWAALCAIGRALLTEAGVKAAALLMIGGCGMAMTAIVWRVLPELAPGQLHWVAQACLIIIGLVVTGLIGMFVLRDIDISGAGWTVKISDKQVARAKATIAAAVAAGKERGDA